MFYRMTADKILINYKQLKSKLSSISNHFFVVTTNLKHKT